MDQTHSISLSNALDTEMMDSTPENDDAPYESESDLSDVANHIVDEPSPATPSSHHSEQGAQDSDASDSSAADARDESDDAEYDMEDSLPEAPASAAREDRSTSVESRRPAKRKLGVEDEHMLANPELYGLRRSVRGLKAFTREEVG